MAVSVFDLFKIGIGPSSSHTVGPMLAARRFVEILENASLLVSTKRLNIELFGSLGATGKGHGTDKALLLGLMGEVPSTVDVETIAQRIQAVRERREVVLAGGSRLRFDVDKDLQFHRRKQLELHANGMRFTAVDAEDREILHSHFYSVGGGFVIEQNAQGETLLQEDKTRLAFPFHSGEELLQRCDEQGLSISQLMLENEKAWRSETEIREQLLRIWQVMQQCVERGCTSEGVLPGGLKVKRRAPRLYRQLSNDAELNQVPLGTMDWVNLFALAVNEENAAGGRVVTAPTNGAAGIIPAVLHYYWRYSPGASEDGVIRFLLCAGAIGILYKENASISGAEVGCQGEVGAACSMAAGALTEVLGGTPGQVENAAEIGMEHNLGLTCDPVGGLVQVPCIERNAMGAVKAINAARMALRGDGSHFVSLDKVIKTMRETGADMKTKYKETSRGGLAVNLVEC
ncbi:MAG: L-serine ammonia-lyase [Candidatus Thiodiazotropha sp. (ex Ctena orbiculata)]|nr:L-serine ammonia-lyase [Candidatus Thiodiazotropha taylori]PUB87642.1 MAG: L-serine ammonia-lyase [gamma proteobacterium symbiont of Ctena orbiculata]MBT2996312.1 L-serine ammonia-lyase [Candidatus Thiodiazotropha taylori]MBT3000254.1 L-serine ammonia-lyase [Candidatus Thiodiazotropha taylori]MBT3028148.1 L-serine ammonia-lyase [Candidatus Thiodiazotropha taylori]